MVATPKKYAFALEREADFRVHLLTPAAKRIRVYVLREQLERGKRSVVLLPRRLAAVIGCHVNTARAAILELEEIGYIRVLRGGGRTGRPREVALGWSTQEELVEVGRRLRSKRWTPPPPGKALDPGKPPGSDPGDPPGNDPGNPLGRDGGSGKEANQLNHQPFAGTAATPSEYPDIRRSENQGNQSKTYTASPLRSRCLSLSAYFTEQIDEVTEEECIRLLGLAADLDLEQGFVQELVNTFSVHDLLPIVANVRERSFKHYADPEKHIRNPGGLIRKTLVARASGGDIQPLEGPKSACEKYELIYAEAFGDRGT